MKIRILVSCSGADFSFRQSETVDASAHLAEDLIAAGYAEEAKPTAKTAKAGAKNDADS